MKVKTWSGSVKWLATKFITVGTWHARTVMLWSFGLVQYIQSLKRCEIGPLLLVNIADNSGIVRINYIHPHQQEQEKMICKRFQNVEMKSSLCNWLLTWNVWGIEESPNEDTHLNKQDWTWEGWLKPTVKTLCRVSRVEHMHPIKQTKSFNGSS